MNRSLQRRVDVVEARERLLLNYPEGVRPWLRHVEGCQHCLATYTAFPATAPHSLCSEGAKLWVSARDWLEGRS